MKQTNTVVESDGLKEKIHTKYIYLNISLN